MADFDSKLKMFEGDKFHLTGLTPAETDVVEDDPFDYTGLEKKKTAGTIAGETIFDFAKTLVPGLRVVKYFTPKAETIGKIGKSFVSSSKQSIRGIVRSRRLHTLFDAEIDYSGMSIAGLPVGMQDDFIQKKAFNDMMFAQAAQEIKSEGIEPDKGAIYDRVEEYKIENRLEAVRWLENLERIEFLETMPADGPTGILEDVAGALGSSWPGLLAMKVNPFFGAGVIYSQIHGSLSESAEAQGVPLKRAHVAGIMGSMASMPLEMLGNMLTLKAMFPGSGKWLSRLRLGAEAVGGNVLEEYAQQAPETFSVIWATNPDLTPIELTAHLTETFFALKSDDYQKEALYAGFIGGLSSGVTIGGTRAIAGGMDFIVSAKQKKINKEKAEKFTEIVSKENPTEKDVEALAGIMGMTKEATSKLTGKTKPDESIKDTVEKIKARVLFQKDPIKSEARTKINEAVKTHKNFSNAQTETYMSIWDGIAYSLAESGDINTPADFYDQWSVEGQEADISEETLFQERELFPEENRLSNVDTEGSVWAAIKRDNPGVDFDNDITIYRATVGNEIRQNDFVAINKSVADQALENLTERGESGQIIEQVVPASDLKIANDATEFIYSPKGKKVYQERAVPWEATRANVDAILDARNIKGDAKLDALDLADEIADKGSEIDNEGYVTLYHRTTKANAEKIVKAGQMVSKEDRLFFGTHPEGQIEGYGDAVVKTRLPLENLEINDVFSNEAHVTLKSGRPGTITKIEAEAWAPDILYQERPVSRETAKKDFAEIAIKHKEKVATAQKAVESALVGEKAINDIADKKDRAFIKSMLSDPLLEEYGGKTHNDVDAVIEYALENNIPATIIMGDGTNINGLNKHYESQGDANFKRRADEDIKKVWGETFIKPLADLGIVIGRQSDEFHGVALGYTVDEVNEILASVKAQTVALTQEMGIDKLGHIKHDGLPTGALPVYYGAIKAGKDYKTLQEKADEIADEMKRDILDEVAAQTGYGVTKDGVYKKIGKKPEGIKPEKVKPVAGAVQYIEKKNREKMLPDGRNSEIDQDRNTVIDGILSGIKDVQAQAQIAGLIKDTALGDYGVTTKQDITRFAEQLDSENIDFVVEFMTIGNGGAINNYFGAHAKTDKAVQEVIGEEYVKAIQEYGGVVSRQGMDFITLLPNYTIKEAQQIRSEIEDNIIKTRDKKYPDLAAIGHPKKAELPVGSLHTFFGFSEKQNYKGKFDFRDTVKQAKQNALRMEQKKDIDIATKDKYDWSWDNESTSWIKGEDYDNIQISNLSGRRSQQPDDKQRSETESSPGPTDGRDIYGPAESEGSKGEPGLTGTAEEISAGRKLYQVGKPFFSQLEDSIQNIKQETAPANQWIGMIKKLPIKQEELEWVGLEGWLKEQKGKISKQDIVDFVQANNVQVEEVEKGGDVSEDLIQEWLDGAYAEVEFDGEEGYVASYGGAPINELFETEEEAWAALREEATDQTNEYVEGGAQETKFSEYQLPGGENYKEFLLTLPEKIPSFHEFVLSKGLSPKTTSKDRALTQSLKDEYAESYGEEKLDNKYRSSHFDEPNVLAHTRFNERIDSEGNKVLFIEEIQSDWHQKGRREGYKVGDEASKEKAKDEYLGQLYAKYDTKNLQKVKTKWTEEESNTWDSLIDPVMESLHAVPDAPFKKSWPLLAIKRMVRYAAENGFDKIAWTPGDVQADRYDLSKQVDSVSWAKYGDDDLDLFFTEIGGSDQKKVGRYTLDGLPDVIGKDLSDKIAKDFDSGEANAEYSGLDLKIGGEGMKAFYDKILPSQVNKFFNKKAWGKAKVETTKIKTGEEVWSLSVTEQMKEKAISEGLPLFQKRETEKLGEIEKLFTEEPAIIRAFEGANPTTLIHETGHLLLKVLHQSRPEDYYALAAWAGVTPDRSAQGLNSWTTKELEQVADGFEKYIMEGKAPTMRLQPIFHKLKEWFFIVYKTIKPLNVEISDEVRGVFDRLVSTEQERMNDPLLETADWYRVDDPAFSTPSDADMAEYENIAAKARQKVVDRLAKKREQEKNKLDKEFKRTSKEMVDELEIYDTINEVIKQGGMGLETVKSRYGQAIVEDLNARRKGMLRKDGPDPDMVATDNGYDSSDSLIEDILASRTKEKEADRIYNELWLEYNATAQEIDAVSYDEFLDEEIEIIHEMMGEKPKPRKELKGVIRKETGQVKSTDYRELRDDLKRTEKFAREAYKMAMLEAKAEAAATEATEKQRRYKAKLERFKEVSKLKNRQKNIVAKMREITKNSRERTTINRKMKRYLRSKPNALPVEYKEQVADILSKYYVLSNSAQKFKPREPLDALLDRAESEGEDVDVPRMIFRHKMPDPRAKGESISIEDLRVVEQMVDSIVHLGKTKGKLVAGKKLLDLEVVVDGLVEKIYSEHKPKPEQTPWEIIDAEQKKIKAVERMKSFFLEELDQPEFIMRALDGWEDLGPVWEAVVKPVKDAWNEELTLGAELTVKLKAAFDKAGADRKWANEKVEISMGDENIETGFRRKEEMFLIALNSKNKGNRTALMEGYGYTEQQLDDIWDMLDAKEKQLCRDVWDLLDTLFPLLEDVHLKHTGARLGKVEGEYFPLVFNRVLSEKAEKFAQEKELKDMFAAEYHMTKPEHGHRQERVGGKMPPLLSISVIQNHVQKTVHDITHQLAVRDVQKIIAHPKFRESVKRTLGERTYRQLMPWLQHVARPTYESNNTSTEYFWKHFRKTSTIANMGFKMTTAADQWTALLLAVPEIGMYRTGQGLKQFYRNPKQALAWVYELSPQMKFRANQFDRDLNQFGQTFDPKSIGWTSQMVEAAFYLIKLNDLAASTPVWIGGYHKGLAKFKGNQDKAVEYADMLVRTTQSTADPWVLSAFQRGGKTKNEGVKMVGMFYTFFAAFKNQMREVHRRYGSGDMNTVELIGAYWWKVILPGSLGGALIPKLLLSAAFGEDEDEPLELIKKMPKNMLGFYFGGVPVLRDVINGMMGNYGYSFTPISAGFESVVSLGRGSFKGVTDEDYDFFTSRKFAKGAIKTAGYTFGIPSAQINITLDGMLDLMNDESDDISRLLFYKEKAKKRKY